MPPYSYESSNSTLIHDLRLQAHPEGGYFAETVRAEEKVKTPFVDDSERKNGNRVLSTTIYYLLTPDGPDNFIHMNLSTTMHVLHQGRSEYVLIYPPNHPTYSNPQPTVRRIIMGPDTSAGEVRQLYVESGVWKKSSLLKEDLIEVENGKVDKDSVGCLITEVVIPGFEWEDHVWMSKEDLDRVLPAGKDNEELRRELETHVKP